MPKRKTHDEYVCQIENIMPHIRVVGKYNGNRTPIAHYCITHDVLWEVSPFNLLQHHNGCVECQNDVLDQYYANRRKTNEQFVSEVKALGNDIMPLEDYRGSRIKIQFQCKLSHTWTSTPHDILAGYGCPYCAGHDVWRGYNDLWTTHPDIAQMLTDADVGYRISAGSHRKVEWTCPYCQTVKTDSPKQIITYGFSCSKCADGISYPNKFMSNLLTQLNVEFVPEYNPEWIKPYRYDFALTINNQMVIVELDGGLGHGCIDISTGGQDIAGLERDRFKNKAAEEHGISLLRIDCNYTNMQARFQYVKNAILNSDLSSVLDLSVVDWDQCNKYATKSLHMCAAKLYDEGNSIRAISEKMKISYRTIYQWLKRMSDEGLCSYKPVIGRAQK